MLSVMRKDSVMPQTIDSYRLRAAECLVEARRAPHETDKAIFLEMAEQWLSLAARGDKAPQTFGVLVG
jgi:hypothetical protein